MMNEHRQLVVQVSGVPTVERWRAHPDRFIVTYPLTGPPQRVVRNFERRASEMLRAFGIESTSYSPDKLMLLGVAKGQEAEVHRAVVEVIAAENLRLQQEREEVERTRPEREAEAAREAAELEEVREAFRRASNEQG